MSWHYQAVREKLSDGSYCYSVAEVYSKSKDFDGGYTMYNYPTGETRKELIEDLEMMLADIKATKTFTASPKQRKETK